MKIKLIQIGCHLKMGRFKYHSLYEMRCSFTVSRLFEALKRVAYFLQQGILKEIAPCNVDNCEGEMSQDCALSEWTEFSTCSAECGGGKHCLSEWTEFSTCSAECGGGKHCLFEWTEFSTCSAECGGGKLKCNLVDCCLSECT
jgi:hypothetical protein